MISKEHSKHAKLERRAIEKFGIYDVALYGSNCSTINALSKELAAHLSKDINIAYVDASHNESVDPVFTLSTIDDQSSMHQISKNAKNEVQQKLQYRQMDLVLLNGNHFQADHQIVIIDEIKKESLHRKLDQLTDVKAFIIEESQDELYDFLKPLVNEELHFFFKSDTDSIANYLKELAYAKAPILKGLVLAGGKSIRMGFDKTEIQYFDKPQKYHLADVMKSFCKEVFISVADSNTADDDAYSYITDSFLGLGPKGAILSAMKTDPNAAWLVIASDLPLVDAASIEYLITNRRPKSIATSYIKDEASFPEPLFAIWEPKAYPVLLDFLSIGYSCPRKTLINSDTHRLLIQNEYSLMNANDPEEMNAAKKQIANT